MDDYTYLELTLLAALWIKEHNRYMLVLITLFAVILISLPWVTIYLGGEFWSLFTVGTVGLFISYGLRFYKKDRRLTIDYLKLTSVAAFPLIDLFWAYNFDEVFPATTAAVILVIYAYDRIVLRSKENMKRSYLVLLIAQSVLILLFLVYALVQRTQAIKNEGLAKEAQRQAIENEKLSLAAQEQAHQHLRIAEQQRKIAQENERRAVAAEQACLESLRKKK